MADLIGSLIGEMYKDFKALLLHPAWTLDHEEFQEKNRNLMDRLDKLERRREYIERALGKGGQSSSKDREKWIEMEKWVKMAKRMEEDVIVLKDRYEQQEKRSCKWLHCCPRYKLGEEMVKKTDRVQKLLQDGEKYWADETSARQPFRPGRRRIRPFESEWTPAVHRETEEKIISYLRDDRVRRVGVWGITGSGKSVILDNLRKNEDAVSMFGIIVLVAISEEWGVKELQDDIMKQLKLKVDHGGSSTVEKGQKISNALQERSCLILIDNLEEKIDLHMILGIQEKKTQKSSTIKVVLASRFRVVCSSMKADDLVHVDRLSPDDAWIMFKELAGNVIRLYPRIEEEARLIVNECDGLPLLIDMVARNLRDSSEGVHWSGLKKQLRGWDVPLEGVEEAYQTLEFCYDSLEESSKKCFLYCALYPEECKIYVDHLLECWISEGFINDESFRAARDAGNEILHGLIGGSFLAKTHSRNYVKMTKLLRKMALKISSHVNDFKLLLKPSDGSVPQYPPRQIQEWQRARRISLMDSQLKELPLITPECTKLLTLFLQKNKNLVDIPKNFFRSMHSLRVLDLYGTGIASLPPSLSKLVSLRALYLNSCFNLEKIPSSGVKELKVLEVLDIRKTKLNLDQIRSLIWLKCLRISFSGLIMVGQRKGRLSDFSSLEELSVCIDSSASRLLPNNVPGQAIDEVAALKNLSSLQFCFPNLSDLTQFVSKRSVRKNSSHFIFHFTVGFQNSDHSSLLHSIDYPIRNSLNLIDTEGSDEVFGSDKVFGDQVLKETDVFGLIKQKKVSSLSSFGMGNMEKMLVCLIEGCDDMEFIIRSDGRTQAVLKHLKDLYIKNLLNLKCIWEGQVPDGSLAQLTSLELSKCPNLKKVFSNGLIQQLHDLKHLKVEECVRIENIFEGSENRQADALPSLKSMDLLHLPQLRSILDDPFKWNWPSLQKIRISFCDKLRSLPFSDGSAAKLRRIEGQKSWWEALEWKDQAYKQYLCFSKVICAI